MPSCHHQPRCPGCPRFGQSGVSESAETSLRQALSNWDLAPALEVHSLDGLGYRHRVRLSVRGKPGRARIGIFEAGSHHLVPIEDCPVHHPHIERVLGSLLLSVNALGIPPYFEARHSGLLRAVQLAVSLRTGKVQLVLLVNDPLVPGSPVKEELLKLALAVRDVPELESIWLGALPERTNALQAERYVQLSGSETLEDECNGVPNFYPPGAFGQANPVLHQQVARRVQELIPQDSRVLEYYCGVGTLGLPLLARGNEVVFNELGEGSLRGLELGLSALGRDQSLASKGAGEILRGKAGDYASHYTPADTVLVDPPRKGLDSELLRRLCAEPPARLVYLSCGLDSLLRELGLFQKSGHYRLTHASAWTYFPYTEHVESLVVLERI